MATLEDVLTSVQKSLQDDAFTVDELTKLANQCIDYCSTRILLPKLETSGVVTTDPLTYEVALPDSWLFARNLYSCFSADNIADIKILNSAQGLQDFYPDYKTQLLTGDIHYIFIRGDFITYYPIPKTAIELTCGFYRQPVPLTDDGDVPYALPYGTHEELLENFILWRAWGDLEDGIEGAKTNTLYYQALFMSAFNELDSMIDHGQSRSRPVVPNGWI